MRSRCERVQSTLPRLVDDSLPRLKARLALRHVAGCDACAAELDRQRALAEELHELREAASHPPAGPPEDLLDSILERVHEPSIRQRVASPARGAVSGARPELSAAAILMAALLVYVTWRAARGLLHRLGDDA